jgi:putative transposase
MIATMEWVSWYNGERIHSYCGDIAPKRFEELYYKAQESAKLSDSSQT